MSTVSSLGSAQISSEITQVEARLEVPVTVLNDQSKTDSADISAWGSISGAVSTLSKSLAGISDVSSINNRTVASTTTTVATATASTTAQTGTYAISGVTLATSQEIYSGLLGSGNAKLTGGAGSLTIDFPNSLTSSGKPKTETVAVGSGSLTLNGVAAAINKVAGGVKASVLGTSTSARLVLQSSATGSSQAFTVAGTGALAQFSYTSSTPGTETSAETAADAQFSVNGVPVTSATNTVSSAISGVTLTLAGKGSSTITVGSAPTALSSAVSSVATSLNSALSAIAKEIAFVPASSATSSASASASAQKATSGPLLGNFTATNLSDQLLTAVSGAAASGMTANSIGLTVSSAGAVTFNAGTFATAYAQNPTAVQSLVTQVYKTLDGISTAAIGGSGSSTNITGTTSKSTGSIGAQTASLQSSITSLASQAAQITKENNAQLEILVQEYTVAENASTQASITQSYLDIFTNPSSQQRLTRHQQHEHGHNIRLSRRNVRRQDRYQLAAAGLARLALLRAQGQSRDRRGRYRNQS